MGSTSAEEVAVMDRPALVACPAGQYRFLPGIDPYSSGVVAMPGWEIVHATLQRPVPYRPGFELIAAHLGALGRPRAALCAIELRIPAPLSFAGFAEFNKGYRGILADWRLLVDGVNPIARTNVAPVVAPPAEPALYGFSYTVPADAAGTPTFVVAGSGELRAGSMGPDGIVRGGETTPDALAEKAAHVMGEQAARLRALGMGWADVTAVDVYTPHALHGFLAAGVLRPMAAAAEHGVHWLLSHPPIQGLEYEMDMRGVRREIRVGR
jgi:hypothetical protein